MDYDFYKFTSGEFEHLIQALMQKLLGASSIVFGMGPDGARELTFEGCASFPNSNDQWKGYWIIQAKYKSRDFIKEDNYAWILKNFKAEVEKFNERDLRKPDNYIFITNAVSTPAGRDKLESIKHQLLSETQNILFICYDELCRFIDNNRDVATAYSSLLLPGDVIDKILTSLNYDKQTATIIGNEIRKQPVPLNKEMDFGNQTPLLCIDFGTSYTIAAVITSDCRIMMIPSDKGNVLVPSVITFFPNGNYVVGDRGYVNVSMEGCFTLDNIKREFNSPRVYKIEGKPYSAETITSLIIKSLKTNAEEYTGFELNEVMISKPANYNITATNRLQEAFRMAGLHIKRVIEESSSACMMAEKTIESMLAFKDDEFDEFLTIDLGGGTFDIALNSYGMGVFQVVNVEGDNKLGGIDYDKKIYDYIIGELNKTNSNSNKVSYNKLKYEAERVKKDLGKMQKSSVVISDIELPDGNLQDIVIEISRDIFIELTEPLNQRIIALLDKIIRLQRYLRVTHLSHTDIKLVMLTGQGTKIFTVRKAIEKLFPNARIVDIYSENAVIMGITYYSGVLKGFFKDRLLLNVISTLVGLKCYAWMENTSTLANKKKQERKLVNISSKSSRNNDMAPVVVQDAIPQLSFIEVSFEPSDDPFLQLAFYELNDPDEMSNLMTVIEVPNNKTTEFLLKIDIDVNATIHLTINDKQSDKSYRYQFNNFHLSHPGFKKINSI